LDITYSYKVYYALIFIAVFICCSLQTTLLLQRTLYIICFLALMRNILKHAKKGIRPKRTRRASLSCLLIKYNVFFFLVFIVDDLVITTTIRLSDLI